MLITPSQSAVTCRIARRLTVSESVGLRRALSDTTRVDFLCNFSACEPLSLSLCFNQREAGRRNCLGITSLLVARRMRLPAQMLSLQRPQQLAGVGMRFSALVPPQSGGTARVSDAALFLGILMHFFFDISEKHQHSRCFNFLKTLLSQRSSHAKPDCLESLQW